MRDVGIVVIGRNEGDRLRRCLGSVTGRGPAVVYVDSASTDGSVELACSQGSDVLQLDMSIHFSAARARNEGFDRLLQIDPEVRFVQFLDGDCEVADGWLERAREALSGRPDVAVVCGRRSERFPDRSIYNRLADIEWDTPVGEAESSGGDAMIRADAFRGAGGYDPSVMAGEEPEFCGRLRRQGWTILRIDAPMTWHDSAMLRFRQWWRRQVRSGYGSLDVVDRFGQGESTPFAKQVRSARLWAVGWPLAIILGTLLVASLGGPAAGFTAGAVLALAWPLQVARLAAKIRPRVENLRVAFAYGALTMVGKWGHAIGQWKLRRDRSSGRRPRLIEYKVTGIERRAAG
jgi:glycosyltransferase involved in cell wall biosynthesis